MNVDVRSRRSAPPRRVVAVALALLAGCAYPSAYVAPRDGRARAVWTGSDVAVALGGARLGDACAAQLRLWSSSGTLRLLEGDVAGPRAERAWRIQHGAGFWVPIYFGAALVASAPGVPPLLPHPVLFLPPPLLLPSPPLTPVGPRLGPPSADLGKATAVLAALALVAMPIVDITLAAVPTEGERSSDAIDEVNVYNDLARSPHSPCAAEDVPW